MLIHRFRSFAAFVAMPGLALSLASSASAQSSTCGSDADCERGYRCDGIGFVDCAVPPCPVGEKCPVLEEGCGELKACVPGATCDSDADCGSAMICYEHTRTSCTGGSRAEPCAAGDDDCATPEPVAPECEELSEKGCLPRYAAPCRNDRDCGGGFRCVEQQSCGCSGSPGRDAPPATDTGTSSGSSDEATAAEDCSCEPSGIFHCESLVDVCAVDSDCPADWTCEDHGVVSSCSTRPEAQPGAPSDLPVCDSPEPVVTHDFRCTPPAFSGYGGAARGSADDFENGPEASDAASSGSGTSDGGCAISGGRPMGVNGSKFALLGAAGLLLRRVFRGRRS